MRTERVVLASVVLFAVLLVACPAQDQSNTGRTIVDAGYTPLARASGVYLKPIGATRQRKNLRAESRDDLARFYTDGEFEYLEGALPNIQKFGGYAGYIVTYYGTTKPGGGCDSIKRRAIGLTSMLKDGQSPESLPPNGKLAELLITKSTGATVGIAALFSGSVSDSSSIDLVATDLADERALTGLDPAKIATAASAALPAGACQVKLVTVASLLQTISKYYHGSNRNANAGAYNINVGGKWQSSTSDFESNLVVRIETRDLH